MRSDQADGRSAYFDTLYAGDPDPWRYEDGAYEIAKRQDTLSFLRPRYRNGCEVGCSIGVLTRELAERCNRLIGLDVSTAAIELARDRLKEQKNVEVAVRHLPYDELPPHLDLLILSEMLYFLTRQEILDLAAMASRNVDPGGDLLIASFDGETQTDLNGRQTSDLFLANAIPLFNIVQSEQRPHYHIHLLRRAA